MSACTIRAAENIIAFKINNDNIYSSKQLKDIKTLH